MILCAQFITVLVAVILGLFLFFKPSQTIALQIKFYEMINWRMEPISMSKEIRNTKFMGLLLTGVAMFLGGLITAWWHHR